MYKICAIILLICQSSFAIAINNQATQPLTFGHQTEFYSKTLAAKQTIHIYTPPGYSQAAQHVKYPVIYTLDGWLLSQTVSATVAHFGNTGVMPQAIVVAIEADNDYAYGPALYSSNSGWNNPADELLSGFSGGKADSFVKFMQAELIPFIDKNYRSNDFRMLIGMSPTAAFALHTFWQAPELFDAHAVFAATDVLGMGYTPDTTFVDKISQSLAENPNRHGYLYIASAQKEADLKPQRNENIAALQKALKPYLGADSKFKLKAEHIDTFGHYPMALPGLISALDLIFPREKWDIKGLYKDLVKQPGNALANIEQHYNKLSQEVGFTVRPNADLRRNALCLRVIAYRLRNEKRYQESIQVYQAWLQDYPKSAKAYAGWAQTLKAQGDNEKAQKLALKALSLAKQHEPTLVAALERFTKSLK